VSAWTDRCGKPPGPHAAAWSRARVPCLLAARVRCRSVPLATARTHLALNAATAAVFAIGYSWRAGDHVALDKTRWGQLALSAVAVAFLIAAIWLGGKLTYR
jgi:uncharacterized membrane protein